ncbi:hypothetical protein [Kitasatospora terrestris]|uniref:Secreted protein n=1 Tax=Kitasatospora terrestris TaxID=258051 RepID=A0ABP9DY30_9ACTN
MSRGRHRHSSLLGRSLPPVATGVLIVAALAALVASPDPLVARSVGVAAVVAAVGLGVLLRQRDKAARTAAQLAMVRRLRSEERFEEQLAEAEYAAEVAEERATRFGRRLTAEKSRLAKAETEIARLLRERAVMVAEQALKEAEAVQKALEAARPKHPASPAAYVRAAAALRHLERRAVVDEARRESDQRAQLELRPKMPQPVPAGQAAKAAEPAAGPTLQPVHPGLRPVAPASAVVTPMPAAQPQAPSQPRALPAQASPASAPAAAVHRPRGGNFSFFGRPGTARAALRAAAPAPAVGDLADVVGDEAVADSERYAAEAALRPADGGTPEHQAVEQAPAHQRSEPQAAPEVVDLTPHDETELLELPELRAGRS